jgi:hypothetical protein
VMPVIKVCQKNCWPSVKPEICCVQRCFESKFTFFTSQRFVSFVSGPNCRANSITAIFLGFKLSQLFSIFRKYIFSNNGVDLGT